VGTPALADVVVLVNPAGARDSGTRIGATVERLLREADVAVRRVGSTDGGDAQRLAHEAVAARPDALVVVGGDGMVHSAAQALAGTDVRLGVVPAGTGNDVARMLGIARRDPSAAVEVLLGGQSRSLDLIDVAGTQVVTVVATGFDSLVNERANAMTWPGGQLRYTLATLAELRTFSPLPYTLRLDEADHRVDAMVVAVGNGPSYGGGLRICEGAEPDDGLLDVVIVHPLHRRQLVWLYPRLFTGTHLSHPAVERHRVRTASVAVRGTPLTAYGDGERLSALPLTARVAPGALQVLVPAGP
jgi:diacylglycerol kinase (ATP)